MITIDMINKINQELKSKECIFKIVSRKKDDSFEIVPLNYNYIDTISMCFSSDFINYLISFFKKHNIAISFNNNCSVFWSI